MKKEVTSNLENKNKVVNREPRGMLKEILRRMSVDINKTDNIAFTPKEIAEEIENAIKGKCNEIICDSVKQFVEAVQRYVDYELITSQTSNEVIDILFELESKGVTVDFGTDYIEFRRGMCIEEIYNLGILIGEAQQKIWLETVCKEVLNKRK